MTKAEFDQAAEDVKKLSKEPGQDGKLKYRANSWQLYKLFKQGNVGDVNTSRPGAFDFVGKAKWDAWNECKGMSKENAQKEYVAYVKELQSKS